MVRPHRATRIAKRWRTRSARAVRPRSGDRTADVPRKHGAPSVAVDQGVAPLRHVAGYMELRPFCPEARRGSSPVRRRGAWSEIADRPRLRRSPFAPPGSLCARSAHVAGVVTSGRPSWARHQLLIRGRVSRSRRVVATPAGACEADRSCRSDPAVRRCRPFALRWVGMDPTRFIRTACKDRESFLSRVARATAAPFRPHLRRHASTMRTSWHAAGQ